MERNRKQKRTGSIDKGIVCMGILILLAAGIGVTSATTITVQPGESLQEAINNLPVEGGIIELAPGIHEVNDTLYPTGTFQEPGGTTAYYSIIINKSNVIIQGTHDSIVMHHTSGYGGDYNKPVSCFYIPDLELIEGPNVFVENVTFKGFTTASTYTQPTKDGNSIISARHVKNFTVEDMHDTSHARRLVSVTSSQTHQRYSYDIYFKNNLMEHCAVTAMFCNNIWILNNTIKDNPGIWSLDTDRNCNNLHIIGNHVTHGRSHACGHLDSGSDFEVRNNVFDGKGGATWGFRVHYGVSNAIIENNTIKGAKEAGLLFIARLSMNNVTVRNNRIYNNYGDGILTANISSPSGYSNIEIKNNVIYNNSGNGINMPVEWINLNVINNIIANNGGYGINRLAGNIYNSYNYFYGNTQGNFFGTTAGTGGIEAQAEPKFADPGNGDFHLKSTAPNGRWDGSNWVTDSEHSPCIDAGDPASDYFNEPDYPNGHINMGAYGNTAEASKSTSETPDTTPPTASNGQPTGTISDNTPTLSVTSNEFATCKGTIDLDETYDNMDFTFSGTDTSHSYDISSPLTDGSHTVYVRGQDTAGNIATTSYSWSFTVDTSPDTTPPTITAHLPIGTGVPISTTISVTFSEAMNNTLVQNAFSVSPPITGSFSWDGNKMVFDPDSDLNSETAYTVTVSTEAKDLAGNSLQTPYSWDFSTASSGGCYSYKLVNPGENIQDAIDGLCAEGGTIELAAGKHDVNEIMYPTKSYITGTTTFYYSIVVNKSNVTIYGTHEAIVKSHLGNGACFQVPKGGYSNITFRDFSTDSSYTYGTPASAIFLAENVTGFTVENMNDTSHARWLAAASTDQGSPLYSENIFFRNNKGLHTSLVAIFSTNVHIENNTLEGGVYAINVNRNLKDVYVIGNNVTGATHALHIHGAIENLIVRNNTFAGRDPLLQDTAGHIKNCIIENNIFRNGRDYGIVISASASLDNYTLRNNLIYNNGGPGILIFYWRNSDVRKTNVINNVIYNNTGDGILLDEPYWILNVTNNIIVNNSGYGINYTSGTILHSYNNVWGNSMGNYKGISAGVGDIFLDPLFADPANGDFHLKSQAGRWNGSDWVNDAVTSPCIDAGDPADDYSNEPSYPIGHINMGAYGNTAEAALSPGAATGTISGNVTDTNGTAIENANLTDGTRFATTNETGEYTIANVPVGTYTVIASAGGYENASKTATVVANETTVVIFTLNPVDATPPVISNVTVPDITGSSATITWTTDEPADSQVEYGWDTNYGLTTSLDTSRVTNHSVLVTGLSTNTTYHYRAKSKDAANNFAVSEDYNFTTPGAMVTITDAIDNRLRSSTPNVVLNDTVWIDVGRLSPDIDYRGLIWFNLSQLNTTDIIKSATLSLFWYYEYHNKSTTVEIYRPMDWAENYVNWNNRTNGVAWNRPGGDWYDRNNEAQGNMPYDAVTFPYGTPDNAYHEFDVTELVQGYVNGTYDNTGFFIKANEVGDSYIAFRSSDWGNAGERPKLVVSYSRGSSSEDNSPLVTNPTATPAAILMDNGRPRIPGTNISQLNVTVTADTGVDTVTIDLSPIGGSPAAPMSNIPGTDIWTITTNATAGINLTSDLAVTATDTSGNLDSSVSIPLTVLRRGDVDRDGDVDIMDSLEIAKYTVGNAPDPGMFIADVDPATGDGIVDIMDALYIAKYTVRNADEV